jgi:hypothetical protein
MDFLHAMKHLDILKQNLRKYLLVFTQWILSNRKGQINHISVGIPMIISTCQ